MYESEPARAKDLAEQAIALLEGTDLDEARGKALHALGMAAWEQQAIPEAVRTLRAAVDSADLAGAAATSAHARSSLALVLSYAGDDAAALAEAKIAEPQLKGLRRAELQHHMAGILERTGRLREAFELATRALRTFRRQHDVLWQAKALNNRGIILAQLGAIGSARQQFERSERLYEQLAMTLGQLKVRNNRAWLASLGGDVPDALRLHEGLQRDLQQLGVPPGLFRLDHASVLLAAALPTEALAAAERAADELVADGMVLDAAEAFLLASRAAHLAGSFDTAQRLARRASDAFEEQHRPAWALRAQHVVVEAAWASGHHDSSNEQLARYVADELSALGWVEAARDAHALVGQMALARGDLDEATTRLHAAKGRGARPANTARLEAMLRAARGDLIGARRALRAGVRVVEEREALLGATELRVRAAREAADLADLGLQWAASAGRGAEVLRWSERRRAASLRLPPIGPPRDRAMATLLASRRAAIVAADQLASADDVQPARIDETRRRVAALDRKIRDRARTISGPGSTVAHTPIDVSSLGRNLGSRALLELVAINDDLAAVTIIDGRCRFDVIASLSDVRSELEYTRLALGRATLSGSGQRPDTLLAGLHRLDELLVAPLERRIANRDVVVVPVASLHTLPWGSLPSWQERAVTVAPSATTWLSACGIPRRQRGRVVVIAGPGLEHAESEALEVGATARAAQVLTGTAATSRATARALDGAAIAHLACHGRFRSDNPLLSSLELADGPLIVYELERLRQAPDVVVLSACDSAVGSASPGEELMGLSATLLSLGSRALIGSVAPVRDEWTRPLMLEFHAQLSAGRSPAAALALARQRANDGDSGSFATAIAFGCFGAGS